MMRFLWLQMMMTLIVAFLVACADEGPETPESVAGAGPLICDEPDRDLGTIDMGARDSIAFEFRNAGSDTVEFERVELTCGCARYELSRATLPGGESARIELELRLVLPPGPFKKTVTIHPRGEGAPLVLAFRGVIQPIYEFRPAIVDLGAIESGKLISRRVTITRQREIPLKVLRMKPGEMRVSGRIVKDDPEAPELEVSFRGDSRLGVFHSKAVFETDPNGPYGDLSIPITGFIRGPIRSDRESIDLAESSRDLVDIDEVLNLHSIDGSDLEIVSLSSGHHQIQARLGALSAGKAEIRLTGRARRSDLKGAQVLIRTGRRDAGELRIPWVLR